MTHLDSDEIDAYTKIFEKYDIDGDGCLVLDEFSKACVTLGFAYDNETIQTMFNEMDADKNGMVTLDEYLTFMGPDAEEKMIANVRRLFNEYDLDGDGLLTVEEIQDAWFNGKKGRTVLSKEEVKHLISTVDANEDGKLNYDEFLSLVTAAFKSDETNTA